MTDESTPEPVALQAKLDQLEQQVADYKLLLADHQNAAKRLKDDADRQRRYATEPVMKDLLTVYDNLELAARAAEKAGDSGPMAKGVAATINLFLDVLRRHGVKKIDVEPGMPLDPNVHQAVMTQPTNDYEPGTIAAIIQQGFLLHDRVLRPTHVIVASEPPAGST
jgi:molecular chaperone GrpE